MTNIKASIFLAFAFISITTGNIFAQTETINWTPQIFSNDQQYITTFQHTESSLLYYVSVETTEVDGVQVTATVVRFAPSLKNPVGPVQLSNGVKVKKLEYNYSQVIDLTGQPNGNVIVIEIFENEIDLNMPESMGNPKGKGTLVSTRVPDAGGTGQ